MRFPNKRMICALVMVPAFLAMSVCAYAQSNRGRSRSDPDGGLTRPRIIAVNRDGRSAGNNSSAAAISSRTVRAYERRVFELINEKRKERGLRELSWNRKVAEVARGHSNEMALYDYFSHSGLDGNLVDQRAMDKGLKKWSAIGENIAYLRGYEDPADYAVERWMLSPSHRENLLDPRWRETGIGLAIAADGTYFFTQVFMVEGKY